MRPNLSPDAYYTSQQFLNEKQYFSTYGWHFIGTSTDLKPGQYSLHNLWGRSVFCQNIGDNDFRAFTNVCPHRYSRLRLKEHGCEPLVCPYHGWAFDPKSGKAIGIPEKPAFCFCDDEETQLGLERWNVERCGNLLFANLNPRTTLAQYLGSFWEPLANMSQCIGKKIDTNSIDISANWKIVVENTLESYHVKKIHPESFYELGASGNSFRFDGWHSAWTAELNEKTRKKAKLINKIYADRPLLNDHYSHFLVFPNMTLATSFGLSFSIQEIVPLAPDRTRFVSHVYFTKLDRPRAEDDEAQSAIERSIVEFNRQVFMEDKEICEQVHLGSLDASKSGFLCHAEARVEKFQTAMLEAVNF
jgi:phenylpropionate dioxygenase-like ring-hydroxylating dioxygenase large terminal subunit